jgi:hypothetical protein
MKAHVMPHADANGRSPQRFITLAADPAGRILITVYSYSGTNRRIISARKVSPSERKRYSKAKRGPVIAPAKGTNRPLCTAQIPSQPVSTQKQACGSASGSSRGKESTWRPKLPPGSGHRRAFLVHQFMGPSTL